MRSDMISTSEQNGVSIKEALKNEWLLSKELKRQGLKGADRFVSGKGRHGQPDMMRLFLLVERRYIFPSQSLGKLHSRKLANG